MLKKLLALTLVFVGVFTLAACGEDVPEMSDLEKLQEAYDGLELPAITGDQITLPATGLHGVTIVWSSSNTAVITDAGVIVQPLFGQPNANVTLTAVLTLNGEDFTKDFVVTVNAKTETEETDLEKANRLIVSLIFANYEVLTDVTLVDTHQGYPVTWTTSNAMYLAADGTVTRPASGETDVQVVLTASYTVGTETVTKNFTFTVVAEEPATVYNTVMDLYTNAAYQEFVEFTGVVTAIMDKGYFISDGTYNLSVYKNVQITGIAVGDEVTVRGTYTNYNTLYQIGNIVYENVNSSGNAVPLVDSPEVKSIADILAFDSSVKEIHGAFFEITGTVTIQGSFNNVYLVDGDDEILISYYGDIPSLEALEAEVGKEVTITVFYYTEHGTNGHIVAFYGTSADIQVNTLPDADALAADVAALESMVPGVTVGAITLPSEGVNGTTFTGWMSDNTAVLANDGSFVALGAETVVVTFTATATKGDLTETVTVEVVVPVLSTVAEVNEMDLGSVFEVSGTVYEISYYGFFIEQDGAYLFIYGSSYIGDVVVGDHITLLADLGAYSGLLQANPIGDITVNSQGNPDTVVSVNTTVAALQNDLVARGTRAIVTGTVSIEGSYDDVFITDSAGGKIKVYYRSNADEIAYRDNDDVDHGLFGQIVTLEVVTYQNGTVLFQGVEADITVETAFTDAYTAQAAADYIMLDEIVEMDLVLPLENTTAVATIAWASDNEAVIATDGTVNRVAGADTVVTLTATVTVGAEVVTRDFVLNVKDANDSDPLSVSEALADTVGGSLLIEGIVTGFYYDSPVIQDPVTGEAFLVNKDLPSVSHGDHIIVRGELYTNTANGNNQARLGSVSLIEIVSSDNVILVDAETDPEVILTEVTEMRTYTATMTVDSFDSFGYVFFDEDQVAEEAMIKFSYETFAPYFQDVYSVGDTLELTFTVLDVHYGDVRVVGVQMPALTDAQAIAAATAMLSEDGLDVTVSSDVEFPAEVYGVALVWASSNEAVVGLDGVVTRPANGSGDATLTVTVTLTAGAETSTITFNVTVPEETPPAATLFISEYIEGGSNNKAIEIYNPNAFDVVMTGYKVCLYSNGAAECGNNIELDTYTILANDVFVISNSSSVAGIADQSDVTSTITYFNGDDAVALLLDGVVIDVIGVIGTDPGSEWTVGTGSTANNTLVRNSSVTTGNTTFTESEWTVYPQDTFDYIGSHVTD